MKKIVEKTQVDDIFENVHCKIGVCHLIFKQSL